VAELRGNKVIVVACYDEDMIHPYTVLENSREWLVLLVCLFMVYSRMCICIYMYYVSLNRTITGSCLGYAVNRGL
jgi:hypothetical protein